MNLHNRFSEMNRDFIAYVFCEQHVSLHSVMIRTVQPNERLTDAVQLVASEGVLEQGA